MSSYPYDPDLHRALSELLYRSLPSLYRVADQPPKGSGELEALIDVLAVPLAVLRQNIGELHGDLFIDSASDWILPLLAEMVGTTLAFPDADSNRRDVRGTVGWRRRKGTPRALQEMGEELTGQLVVTQEGWQRVQLSQDLNQLRHERVVPDLRPATISELAWGPLDRAHHAADLRAISRRTGKYHPRHMIHWVHPTRMFDASGWTPAEIDHPNPGAPPKDRDLRYAFRPLGTYAQLRAARSGPADPLRTDRVPPMHFAEAPDEWFGRRGRFGVRICGLAAGVGESEVAPRFPSRRLASTELLAGAVSIEVLEADTRQLTSALDIEVLAAPLPPGSDLPNLAAAQLRSSVPLEAHGPGALELHESGDPPSGAIALLRLSTASGGEATFPELTLQVTGATPAARLGADDPELAREGFLRGALFLRVPAGRVEGQRWYRIARDGSLYHEHLGGEALPLIQLQPDADDERHLEPASLAAPGPGPAWPPLPGSADPAPLAPLPPAPGQSPVLMHGGLPVRDKDVDPPEDLVTSTPCALGFALRYVNGIDVVIEPLGRLRWPAGDPSVFTWEALGHHGLPTDGGDRFWQIAEDLIELQPASQQLLVRFECGEDGAVLPPAEVAWATFDGRPVLIHLPTLEAHNVSGGGEWVLNDIDLTAASAPTAAGADGSTWRLSPFSIERMSLGPAAPLRDPTPIRRRRVRRRTLCNWKNEGSSGQIHRATEPGCLDIDVLHGLFALNASEPPQRPLPPAAGAPSPPSVTVDLQDGFTLHLGARAAAREAALGRRLAQPTRLVTRSGRLHHGAPIGWLSQDRYPTLAQALEAISEAPCEGGREVIQIEDSATYFDEELAWPTGVTELTIQAAERERPLIHFRSWNGGSSAAPLKKLSLIGLALAGPADDLAVEPGPSIAAGSLVFPPSERVELAFCTFATDQSGAVFTANPGGTEVEVWRCLTGPLDLEGGGTLRVRESILDSGDGPGEPALTAEQGTLELDRVTVIGASESRRLYATEVIFLGEILIEDRFNGCVRFSRVPGAETGEDDGLPRKYRLARGTEVRFVTQERDDPAYARLAESCDPAIRRGAEDGSEMGAFHETHLAERYEAFLERLREYTPANLATGLVRLD